MRLPYSKKTFVFKECKILHRQIIHLFLLASMISLTSCSSMHRPFIGQTLNEGYIFEKDPLEFIPLKSSMDQVLLVLGSPSLTAVQDDKIFYYISQKRYRAAAFLKPHIINRQVLAIYFNDKDEVSKIAQYGLKDGRVFDFVSRSTPTTGRDQNIIKEILSNTTFVPIDFQK